MLNRKSSLRGTRGELVNCFRQFRDYLKMHEDRFEGVGGISILDLAKGLIESGKKLLEVSGDPKKIAESVEMVFDFWQYCLMWDYVYFKITGGKIKGFNVLSDEVIKTLNDASRGDIFSPVEFAKTDLRANMGEMLKILGQVVIAAGKG